MNARWFRENLSVIVFGVVFVAILSTLIWLLQAARATQTTVHDELVSQQTELGTLQNSKQPPSQGNINLLKQDSEIVSNLYNEMQQAAFRAPLRSLDLQRNIDFSLVMRSNITALADLAKSSSVTTPDSFAFGFSRYDATLPCSNPSAQGDDCRKILALLSKQLVVIDKLAGIMISNKVDSIDAIHRTEVEPGGASPDALAVPITTKPLYTSYPFEIDFVSDTPTLRNLLNSLSEADCLFIVRTLNITSVSVVFKAPDQPSQTNTTTAAGVDASKTPLPPRMGRTRRLKVSLRLDFVEFNPAKQRSARN